MKPHSKATTEFFSLYFSFVGNVRSPGAGGGPRGAPRRGRGAAAAGAKRGKRPVPTAEQLDAELDAYVKEIKWKQLIRTVTETLNMILSVNQ